MYNKIFIKDFITICSSFKNINIKNRLIFILSLPSSFYSTSFFLSLIFFVLVLSAFLFRVLEIDNLNNITKSFLLLCVSLNSYYLKFILLSRLNILFNSSYLYFKEKLNNINNLINKIDIIIN